MMAKLAAHRSTFVYAHALITIQQDQYFLVAHVTFDDHVYQKE